MVSENNEGFTTYLVVWMSFIYFCCLITVTITARTMLTKGGESEQPCLVVTLGGKLSVFSS